MIFHPQPIASASPGAEASLRDLITASLRTAVAKFCKGNLWLNRIIILIYLETQILGKNKQIFFLLLLLLLLSRFSRVQLCATPWTAAHQDPLSLGFSRQEHWSGLPFPSPMHESEKWKWRRTVVSDSLRPHGLQPTRLLHPWDSPGKSTGVGCHCLFQYYT